MTTHAAGVAGQGVERCLAQLPHEPSHRLQGEMLRCLEPGVQALLGPSLRVRALIGAPVSPAVAGDGPLRSPITVYGLEATPTLGKHLSFPKRPGNITKCSSNGSHGRNNTHHSPNNGPHHPDNGAQQRNNGPHRHTNGPHLSSNDTHDANHPHHIGNLDDRYNDLQHTHPHHQSNGLSTVITYNMCDAWGQSPLHVAAAAGLPGLVHFLLRAGSDPCLRDIEGQTALIKAVTCGHRRNFVVVATILDVDMISHLAAPILPHIKHARCQSYVECKSTPSEACTNFHRQTNNITNENYHPIDGSTHIDGVQSAKEVMDGPDSGGSTWVDLADSHGSTALLYAVDLGRHDLVALLLRAGADVNKADSRQRSPLHVAVLHGRVNAAMCLLRHPQCDIQREDIDGYTPFILVIWNPWKKLNVSQQIHLARLLVRRGAEVTCCAPVSRRQALQLAWEKTELVKELLMHGTAVNMPFIIQAQGDPESFLTPTELAALEGRFQLVGLLRQAGARFPCFSQDSVLLRRKYRDQYDKLCALFSLPMSLMDIARVQIRKCFIGLQVLQKIAALPLPSATKAYLSMQA